MIVQYKCPGCGANMVYDAPSGLLKCESCGKTMSVPEAARANTQSSSDNYQESEVSSADIEEINGEYEDFKEQSTYKTYDDNDVSHFHCENCGAELITDAYTSATKCTYCGSPMILSQRLSGKMAPASVLPFTISKEQAQQAFVKWRRHGLVTPKDFMMSDRIKEISGMYIPFWLYDMNARGEAMGTATRVNHYSDSQYNYTKTKYYHIYRKVDLHFDRIPADASKKMDDHQMDLLEPFSFEDLKDFETGYLSGYSAEMYSETDKDIFPRIEKKTYDYMDEYIESTVNKYSSFIMEDHSYEAKQKNAEYTMLPVWMLCYHYKNKDYMFAMNGQTGKICGKPPISKGRIAKWFSLITSLSFILINIIILLTGGIS